MEVIEQDAPMLDDFRRPRIAGVFVLCSHESIERGKDDIQTRMDMWCGALEDRIISL